MPKRKTRSADGFFHVGSKKYKQLVGSRAQVYHETAYKTSGGLTKEKIMKNKNGRYVSRKKHNTAKRENRLKKYGWGFKRGVFGAVKLNTSPSKKRSKRRSKKRKAKSATRRVTIREKRSRRTGRFTVGGRSRRRRRRR